MATLKDLTVLGASRFVSDLYGANIYQNGTKVSVEGHTHNYQPTGNYAPTGHTHTQYSPTGHTHTQYSPTGHTHTQYSPTGHTHNYQPTGNYVTIHTTQTITGIKTFSSIHVNAITTTNSAYIISGIDMGENAYIKSYVPNLAPGWLLRTATQTGSSGAGGYVNGSYLPMATVSYVSSLLGLSVCDSNSNEQPNIIFSPIDSNIYLLRDQKWKSIDDLLSHNVNPIIPQEHEGASTDPGEESSDPDEMLINVGTGVSGKYYILGTKWHSTAPTGLYGISISNTSHETSPYMIRSEIYSGSDIALKKDIKPISDKFIDSLFTLSDIIYDFTWKDSNAKSSGFIAQYIEDIMPETIDGEEGSKHVNYDAALSKVVGAMFKKIKQLEDKINQQQLEINELKQNIKGRT